MSSRGGSKRDFERTSTAGERRGERQNTGGGGAGEGGDRLKSEVNKVKRQDSSVEREGNCCRNGWTHTQNTQSEVLYEYGANNENAGGFI